MKLTIFGRENFFTDYHRIVCHAGSVRNCKIEHETTSSPIISKDRVLPGGSEVARRWFDCSDYKSRGKLARARGLGAIHWG